MALKIYAFIISLTLTPSIFASGLKASDAGTATQWSQAGFQNPIFESFDDQSIFFQNSLTKAKPTHQLKIKVVLFRKANWSKNEVITQIQNLAQVYLQCGIKISVESLIETDALNGWIDTDYSYEKTDKKIVEALPEDHRPILFFIRSNKQKQFAYSWPDEKSGKTPRKLIDTIWITTLVKPLFGANDLLGSVEAHELGHLLLNESGHDTTNKKNFMAGRESPHWSNFIRPDQCEKIKRHKLIKPLIQ